MHTSVILNPQAGSAVSAETLTLALSTLGSVSVRETHTPGDGTRLAREALSDGCDLIIAAGGDGTINEVVNGLAEDWQAATFGILPLGTGNDLARTLAVPTDVNAAIEVMLQGKTCQCDVVCVESDATRYFLNVSAGGFSGLVDERLTDEVKSTWGPMAYIRTAMAALPDLTDYHMTLQFDDEEPQHQPVYNIVIANARFVAGGVPIAPEALIDDGLVDVLIVPAASLPQLTLVVPQILLGRHLDNEELQFRQAHRVRVESQPGMWFNTDGELVGNQPATFTVLPRALRVIVGPDFDATVERAT